jgi:hypothetical protein
LIFDFFFSPAGAFPKKKNHQCTAAISNANSFQKNKKRKEKTTDARPSMKRGPPAAKLRGVVKKERKERKERKEKKEKENKVKKVKKKPPPSRGSSPVAHALQPAPLELSPGPSPSPARPTVVPSPPLHLDDGWAPDDDDDGLDELVPVPVPVPAPVPRVEIPKPMGLFVCTNHPSTGVFDPVSVISAENAAEAIRLIRQVLYDEYGLECEKGRKIDVIPIDRSLLATYFINLGERFAFSDCKLGSTIFEAFVCTTHYMIPPSKAATLIIAKDEADAERRLKTAIESVLQVDDAGLYFEVNRIDTKENAVHVLSMGDTP